MIKLLGLATLLLVSSGSCRDKTIINTAHAEHLVQQNTDSIYTIEMRYQALKDSVSALRKIYKAQYQQAINKTEVVKLARASFIQLLEKDFFNIWNGTQWDFYGTTQVPQKGKIACGYFVTTVLRDMGVKIDRVAMAETYSEKLIKTLIQPKHIKKYVPFNLPNFVAEKQKEADNVYIVGLDNHVGFVIVENHQVWFLHSSVLQPGAVVKERADTSMALQFNYYTVAGNLTADELFLETWILMKHQK
jgi:hypothetical protein